MWRLSRSTAMLPPSSITVIPGSQVRVVRLRTIPSVCSPMFQDTRYKPRSRKGLSTSQAARQQRPLAGRSGSYRRFRHGVAFARGKKQIIVQLVLARIHIPVAAMQSIQLGMRAPLDDIPVFDHQYLAGAANRRQTVRDDESRAAPHQVRETLLDHRFRFGIEAGGGFVQNEDSRVREYRPCD